MKKFNLAVIILFFLIIIIVLGGAIFAYYKKINNKGKTALIDNYIQKNITETQSVTPPDLGFDPASLNWEQALSSAPWEGRDFSCGGSL